MKVMETVNVVIDESSDAGLVKNFPKRFFLPNLEKFKKLLNKSLYHLVLQILQAF